MVSMRVEIIELDTHIQKRNKYIYKNTVYEKEKEKSVGTRFLLFPTGDP